MQGSDLVFSLVKTWFSRIPGFWHGKQPGFWPGKTPGFPSIPGFWPGKKPGFMQGPWEPGKTPGKKPVIQLEQVFYLVNYLVLANA